jgi:hypothetical protein
MTLPTIIQADNSHLDALVELFDAYRVWYEKPSDLPGAYSFLAGLMERALLLHAHEAHLVAQ